MTTENFWRNVEGLFIGLAGGTALVQGNWIIVAFAGIATIAHIFRD